MKQYLGIDSSTQSLKGIIIDRCGILAEESVHFGSDLPEYRSPNGFLAHENPEIVHANPLMWLAALDLLFDKMQKKGIRLDRICGISGSGQQHGSVYLNSSFEKSLASLDAGKTLAEQLQPTLSRATSPIWMDHSTRDQCRALSERFGSRLQEITGSAPAERFTGPQIMKFARQDPAQWANTNRIHLVSSFLCSVLCGKSTSIDYGDGAGMNLLNLKTLKWDSEITGFTAPNLAEKLPLAVPSNTIEGGLCGYFGKYGLKPGIPVVVWSGDNPCSLIGIGCAQPGTIGISLGTSDTVFAPMSVFKTDPLGCGHVFGNPAGGFMSLICFANGSLAREEIRKKYQVDWAGFEEEIRGTVPGNGGSLMLPRFSPECTPSAPAGVVYGYDELSSSAGENIRALLESQALSMRLHSKWTDEKVHTIHLTGGASKLNGFRKILADVFQADVMTQESSNAAGLGAAMRAANAVDHLSFEELAEKLCLPVDRVLHNPDTKIIYDPMLEQYKRLEKGI